MPRFAALAALSLLATAAAAQPGRWTPRPTPNATEPSEVIAHAPATAWRPIDPENLLVMDLQDGGRIVIELAPAFAPIHVANMRRYARAGWWNNATIYRVQDNYVAQWGNGDAEVPLPEGVVRRPPAEYERPSAGLTPHPLGFPDSYAPMTGFVDGWPMAWDPARRSAWLTHCYASVGVGRDLAPDTGTGGELYAVIGHSRATFSAAGALISQRRFTNSCLNVSNQPPPDLPAGESLASLVVTHLLDPIPTEIHVFMSIWTELPITVSTAEPHRAWQVTGDRIEVLATPPNLPATLLPPSPGSRTPD